HVTIVVDTAHGACSALAMQVFAPFVETVVLINNKPNGNNINDKCGSTHPLALTQEVQRHNADIGFAFDGDGDRIIAVDRKGVIKDGDDIISLLLQHPQYRHTAGVVATTMSNMGLERTLNKNQK